MKNGDPDCEFTTKEKHHIFPKDEKQGSLFLKAVASSALENLTYEEVRKYRVCELHFLPENFCHGARNLFSLKAVPFLY